MKKTSLSILLFLFAFVSLAQIQIAPRAGVVLTNVTSDEQEGVTTKSRIGFTIGAALIIPVNDVVSFQPELNYIQKGGRAEASLQESSGGIDLDFNVDLDSRVDYLEMPLMAKALFGAGATKFYFIGGPSIGFGVGGKYKTKVDFTYTDNGQTEKLSVTQNGDVKFGDTPENPDPEDSDVYINNRIDLGVQIGMGVVIKEKVMVDLRYGLGFTDMVDDEDSSHRVLQLSVAMPLAIKNK